MKEFLILYRSSVPASEQIAKASPEQMKAGMDLWTKWANKPGKAIVDLGMPVGNAQQMTGAVLEFLPMPGMS